MSDSDPLGSLLGFIDQLEQEHGPCLDVEWAYDGKTTSLVQVRPMTALPERVVEVIFWQPQIKRSYGVQYCEMSIRSLAPQSSSPYSFVDQMWVPEDGEVTCFIGARSWNRLVKECAADITLDRYPQFVEDFYRSAHAYIASASAHSADGLRALSNEELHKAYMEYQVAAVNYCTFIWTTYIANKIAGREASSLLKARFESHPDQNAIERLALTPDGKDARMDLVDAVTRHGLDEDLARELYDQFRWWNCRDIHEEPFRFEQFKSMLSQLRAPEPLPQDEGWFDSLSEVEQDIIERAKVLTHIKDLRDNFRCMGVYAARQSLFTEIARRFEIDVSALSYWTEREIREALLGSVNLHVFVEKRREAFAIGLEGEIECYSGDEVSAFITRHDLPAVDIDAEGVTKIHGTAASKGAIRGVARVLRSPAECHRVQKGDILVASTTNTGYMPAFYRAAGIVTDEGDMTCHAAVQSRELHIPCVTATRNATKVLKDGQPVELIVTNANGLVRLLDEQTNLKEEL